jgi:hypothetical protein
MQAGTMNFGNKQWEAEAILIAIYINLLFPINFLLLFSSQDNRREFTHFA